MPLLDSKVSWQIARGERVCIIGRNGTGKIRHAARLKAIGCLMTAVFGVRRD
jgi:ABC-type molybdenum transport system ATPase subunit/photorepair protein PhrA